LVVSYCAACGFDIRFFRGVCQSRPFFVGVLTDNRAFSLFFSVFSSTSIRLVVRRRITCGGKGMNDQQYFQTTSLAYQLKAAQRELSAFRSGEVYGKLRADYEKIIREQDIVIKKLRQERDEFSFSRKKITNQWMY